MNEAALKSLIVGESFAIRRLRQRILQLAPARLRVVIQGPTGSGKELVAQALHRASGVAGRIVAVNICAAPDSLFESSLFGHVRGAFTGALRSAPGLLAEADRGTLFLDEIGSLGLQEQAKLLRAIETGVFRPVGGDRDRSSDFRLLSATNEDLEQLVERGRFRADLWFRLRGAVLDIPPLKERREDIPALVEVFRQRTAPDKRISTDGLRYLQQQDWPGNVRELQHVIECAAGLSSQSVISREELVEIARTPTRELPTIGPAGRQHSELLALLEGCGWDTAVVAAKLGVHRVTVYRRMQRAGIRGRSAMNS